MCLKVLFGFEIGKTAPRTSMFELGSGVLQYTLLGVALFIPMYNIYCGPMTAHDGNPPVIVRGGQNGGGL